MGATTNLRLTVAVMLVWAGLDTLSGVSGLVDRWSPDVEGTMQFAALALFLPAEIAAVVWALRRRPRWPSLDADRLAPLLEPGERTVSVAAVRIAGTQPWRPTLLYVVVGLGGLLVVVALNAGALALVFVPLALLVVPAFLLTVGFGNDLAERAARRGGRRDSTALSVPLSGGRPPDWLVLTDRRLAIVGPGRGGQAELVWRVPRSELEGVARARRSWRTLDRTIRLRFADGSSVRLATPDARPFLAACG
jgi:hypothetical protein